MHCMVENLSRLEKALSSVQDSEFLINSIIRLTKHDFVSLLVVQGHHEDTTTGRGQLGLWSWAWSLTVIHFI